MADEPIGSSGSAEAPGPVITAEFKVQSAADELRAKIAEGRSLIDENNIQLAVNARKALAAQTDDLKAYYRDQQALLRINNAEQRAGLSENQESLREALAQEREITAQHRSEERNAAKAHRESEKAARAQAEEFTLTPVNRPEFKLSLDVEGLKRQLDERRQLILDSNLKAAQDSLKLLGTHDAAVIASIKKEGIERANATRVARAEAAIISSKLPKEPLPVHEVNEGSKALSEGFHIIREELGALLGPLNGVTGRLTAIASLFGTLAKAAKESTAHSGEAVKAIHSLVAVTSSKILQASNDTKGVSAAIGAIAKNLTTSESGFVNLSGLFDRFTGKSSNLSTTLIGTGKEAFRFGEAAGGAVKGVVPLAGAAEKLTGAVAALPVAAAAGESVIASLGTIAGVVLLPLTLVATAIATVAAVLLKAGYDTAKTAQEYQIIGEQIGATAQQVQGLSLVAATSGTSLQEMTHGLARLSFALTGHGGAGQSGGDGVEPGATRTRHAVELLIGSVRKSNGDFQSPIDTLKRLADVFQRMPDGMAKSALASEIFGQRIGVRLIPALNKGSRAIQELIDTANTYGANLTGQAEKADAWDLAIEKLNLSFGAFKQGLGDTGVFTIVTKAIDGATKALHLFNKELGFGTKERGEELAQKTKKYFDIANVQGKDALTERGNKQQEDIAQYIQRSIEHPNSIKPSRLQEDLYKPEDFAKVKAAADEAIVNAQEETDERKKGKAIVVETLATLGKLNNEGAIEVKNARELASLKKKNAEETEREYLASTGLAQVLADRKKAEETLAGVDKANAKYGILGDVPGSKNQPRPLSIVRQELNNLIKEQRAETAKLKTLDVAPGAPAPPTGPIKKALKSGLLDRDEKIKADQDEAIELVNKNREAAKQLAAEHKRLIEEFKKEGQAAVDAAAKQLSLSDQVEYQKKQVAELNQLNSTQIQGIRNAAVAEANLIKNLDKRKEALSNIDRLTRGLAEAQKAVVAAEQASADASLNSENKRQALIAQRDSITAHLQTGLTDKERKADEAALAGIEDSLKGLETKRTDTLHKLAEAQVAANAAFADALLLSINSLPAGAARDAQETQLLETYKKSREASRALTGATKSLNDERNKEDDSKFKSDLGLAKILDESRKLDEELGNVGEKLLPLRQRFLDAQTAVLADALAVAELKKQLASLETGKETEGERDKIGGQLVAAQQRQLADVRTRTELQAELAKQTFKVADAYSALNDVLSGFGSKTPKAIQDIEKMVVGLQKMYKLIQFITAARGVNVNLSSSGQASNVGGLFGGLFGGQSGGGLLREIKSFFGGQGSPGGSGFGGFARNLTGVKAPGTPTFSGDFGTPVSQFGQTLDAQGIPTIGQQAPAGITGPGAAGGLGQTAAPPPLSSVAGPVIAGAGIGVGIGGAVGGTVGAVGGGIAGAAGGLGLAAAASPAIAAALGSAAIAIPVIGAIVGAALLIIGILHKRALAETHKLAEQAQVQFKTTIDAFNAGQITLGAALKTALGERQDAFTRLAGKTGGWKELTKLIPELDAQIAQLKKQQQDIFKAFDQNLGNLRFPEGVRSTVASIADLNKTIREFINAGGDAATAAEYLARSLAQIKTDTQQSLLSSEQGVVGLMLQELDLEKQKQDLIRQNATTETQRQLSVVQLSLQSLDLEKQKADLIRNQGTQKLQQEQNVVGLLIQQNDLERQKAETIRGAAKAEYDVLNQGVISRSRSVAQNQASQILEIRRKRDLDLKSQNQAIDLNKGQIGDQAKLFGLTGNLNDLLARQVELQKTLTNEALKQQAIDQQLALSNINFQITKNKADLQVAGPVAGLPTDKQGLQQKEIDLQYQLDVQARAQAEIDRQLALKSVNDQIAGVKAQIGLQDQLFGLTYDRNTLLNTQLQIQTQITQQQTSQLQATVTLLALLAKIAPGGTQVDLNDILKKLGGPLQIPGLPQPTGKGGGLFDPTEFIALLTKEQFGQKILKQTVGTAFPTTLTPQQEQAVIAAVKAFPKQSFDVKHLEQQLQDIYNGQLLLLQDTQLPGGASGQFPAGTPGQPGSTTSSAPVTFQTSIQNGGVAAATSIQSAMVTAGQTAATTIYNAMNGVTTATGVPAAAVTTGTTALGTSPQTAITAPIVTQVARSGQTTTSAISSGLAGVVAGTRQVLVALGSTLPAKITAGNNKVAGAVTDTGAVTVGAIGTTTTAVHDTILPIVKTVYSTTAPITTTVASTVPPIVTTLRDTAQFVAQTNLSGFTAINNNLQHLVAGEGTATASGTPAPAGTSSTLFPTVDYPTGPGGAPIGGSADTTLPAPLNPPATPTTPRSGGVLGTVGKIATGVGAVGTGAIIAGGLTGLSVASGGIAGAIGGAASAIGGVGGAIGGVLGAVGSAVGGAVSAIGTAVPILGTIGSAIGGVLGSVGSAISGALGSIFPIISGALGPIGLAVGGLVLLLSHIFNSGPSDAAKTASKTFVASVTDVVASFNSGAIDAQLALAKIQQLQVDAETRLGHDKANKPLLANVDNAVAPLVAELKKRIASQPAVTLPPPSVPTTPLATLTQLPRNTGDTGFIGGLFSGGGASTAAKDAAIGFGNGINSVTAAFNAGTLRATDALSQIQKIEADAVTRLGHDSGNKEWLANITNQVGPIVVQLAQDIADATKAATAPPPPPAPVPPPVAAPPPPAPKPTGPPTDPITGLPILPPAPVLPPPVLPPEPVIPNLGGGPTTKKPEPCVPVDPGVFTAPFLPFLKASTKLIDVQGAAPTLPNFLPTPNVPVLPGNGPISGPVVTPRKPITGGPPPVIVGGPTQAFGNQNNPVTVSTSAPVSITSPIPLHNPLGLGSSDLAHLRTGLLPSTPKIPTVPTTQNFNMGGVTVNITGTNLNPAQLSRAVTDGLNHSFNDLRASRRGGVNGA